jgi:hypothetical protein
MSVFDNGGFIGRIADYTDTSRYIIGEEAPPPVFAAPTFVGASTASSGSTITLPTGMQPGDLVIVATCSDNTTPALPTGYTNGQNGNTNSTGYRWSYKVMPNPVDTTASGLTNDTTTTHLAMAFRGFDPDNILDVTPPNIATATSGMPNPPSITTANNDAMIVAIGFLDDDLVAGSVTAPSGYTLATASQSPSAGATVMAAYKVRQTAGADDPAAFGGTGTDSWVGATLALKAGPTVQYETLTYVGGRTQSGAGTTANISVSLGSLTGGLDVSPQAGDLVVIAIEMCGTADKSYRISGYTQIADLYANDTEDSNLQVGYKFMGATPDTTATITGGTGSTADAYALVVHVWRHVDPTTPIDVTPTTVTQIDTGIPNPPAITPVTPGAQILVAAGAAHTGGTDTFGATYLANFRTVGGNDDNDATVGMGSIAWTTGSYDPAAWTFSQTDSTAFSTNSVTFALRPEIVDAEPEPIFGNEKNSGIWSLQTVWANATPFGGNVGQEEFTASGSFVVPAGITSISAAVVGGGGGGGGSDDSDETGGGGGGGGLAYATFEVTPDETLTVTIGSGGNGGGTGGNGAAGGASSISRAGTPLVAANGGSGGQHRGGGGAGGAVTTGTGGTGGAGGAGSNRSSTNAGGGGGAGGYSGNGGAGGSAASTGSATAGSGGGGGGGGGGTNNATRGGGGVGLLGEGTSGAAGAANVSGSGGSGGEDGTNIGGAYGGGGRGAAGTSVAGSAGAPGAARIIWGSGRSYPSTRTEDETGGGEGGGGASIVGVFNSTTSSEDYSGTLTDLQVGDVLFFTAASSFGLYDYDGGPNDPRPAPVRDDGYTTIIAVDNDLSYYICYKVLTSENMLDTSVYTGNGQAYFQIVQVRGLELTQFDSFSDGFQNRLLDTSIRTTSSGTTAVDPPSITAGSGNFMLCINIVEGTLTMTAPTNYTLASSFSYNNGVPRSISSGYRSGVSAGTEDPGSFSSNPTSIYNERWTFALATL